MTGTESADPKARKGGPPLWFAIIAALGIGIGVLIILLEVLGVGISVGAQDVNTSPAPAGSAAASTADRVTLALQGAGLQVQQPNTDFRTSETPTLLATPRRLLQAVVPSDPSHGYIVIYEFPDANAADAAGREFSAFLSSGTGAIGFPRDEQFVLRRLDNTLIFYPWSPSVSPDPSIAKVASVLGGLGQPLTGQ
jgi:hypothetical protein